MLVMSKFGLVGNPETRLASIFVYSGTKIKSSSNFSKVWYYSEIKYESFNKLKYAVQITLF